jgi:RND superfamily putative drug exporter
MYPLALTGLTTEAEESAAVTDIRDRLAADLPDGLRVQLGGPGALNADMDAVFEGIDETLMLVTVLVVTGLLIMIYRSPLLWLLPLICVAVAAVCAMAVVYVLIQAFGLTVSTMSSSLMTVLVFGAGTDYALLLIARYREELRRHWLPYHAMLAAIRGCGPAVLASSGTVAAGLLCLLAADLNSSSGLGPVGAVGVLCALAAMLTLLPALLVLAGRRIFWPLMPRYGATPSRRPGVFARMGSSVARRPATVLLVSLAVLATMVLGVLNLPGQLKDEDSFVSTPESVSAMETLAAAYPERSSRPITVLADSDRVPEVLAEIEATEGVAAAETGRSGTGWTEISVLATAPPESDREKETVLALRERLSGGDGLEGAPALVGGQTAEQMDLARTSAADARLVIPLVLTVVLLILMVLLRSVLAPVILLAAVVVSWGSALGLAGLLFSPAFGFEGTTSGLPLLSFVFGVALGVDYGIFLMHRMREETLAGSGTREAALAALRTTGGVIASAGVVLAATFAVLTTLPLVMMVQIGFVIAVGVLLDTFLVRTYVVTSASWLLGDRVWWPGPLSRRAVPARSGDDARYPMMKA